MNTSIKSRIKRRHFRSLDAFASELVKSYDEFEGMNYRILSMRIAELDKGKAVWWKKKKDLLDRLLNVLEMDESDLDIRKAESRHAFKFQAFPLIPALDLRVKDAWKIGEPALTQSDSRADSGRYASKPTLSYWFDSVGIAPRKIQWLQITDAVEYRLLTHRLTTVGRRDIIVEEALDDVIEKHLDRLLDPSLLILVFKTASYDAVVHLDRISRAESPRLIVSPKSVPSPDSDANAQERGNRLSSSNPPNPGNQTTPPQIESWLWRLKPNWRALMLRWLDQHFGEHDIATPFNYEVAQTLLDKFDRDAQWFADVHDVLILSRAIDFHSQEELQDALHSKGRAYDLLQLLLGRNKTQLKLLRQLVAAR
ncbi:MAG TPA: hypothetical protein VJU59_44940, partial [Paraburkholderia sp.]|uniref:hypothetical protein n=1 Tax=Paraburkholderia sp. TaxID=1926495 RepID=UPI002B486C88